MSGDRLRVDTHMLREAGSQLRTVAQEFSNADAESEDVAEAVGHPGLAGKLRDFATKWDGTRKDMLENIASLAKAASATGEAFDEVDQSFADALRGGR
jgi:uncharacterized protein YukE